MTSVWAPGDPPEPPVGEAVQVVGMVTWTGSYTAGAGPKTVSNFIIDSESPQIPNNDYFTIDTDLDLILFARLADWRLITRLMINGNFQEYITVNINGGPGLQAGGAIETVLSLDWNHVLVKEAPAIDSTFQPELEVNTVSGNDLAAGTVTAEVWIEWIRDVVE